MDAHCNNDELSRRIQEPGLIFFYQRWSELLNPKTLDSYQVNYLNAHCSLKELLSIVDDIIKDTISDANLESSISETLRLLESDKHFKNHAPFLRVYLQDFLGRSKSTNPNNLYKLKYTLTKTLKQIDNLYFDWVLEDLKKAIIDENYSEIDYAASALASECIYSGWSLYGLHKLRNKLMGRQTFDNKWTSLERILKKDKQERIVLIRYLKATPDLEPVISNLRDLGIEVFTGDNILEINKFLNDRQILKGFYYFAISISSFDEYSAFFEAMESVLRKLSLLTFYRIVDAWPTDIPDVVTLNPECTYGKSLNLKSLFEITTYGDKSQTIYHKAIQVLNIGVIDESSIAKIEGTFLYNNLSRLSWFQEVRYINLWVALESLLKTGEHGNIINHIKEIVPPAISYRYVYRRVRNFAEDCKRCGVLIELNDGNFLDLEQESKTELTRQLINIFYTHELYQKLETACQCNSLLLYRCRQILQQILTGKAIAKNMDNHKTKVKWHVERLYRVRNSIIHSAFAYKTPINLLINNLSEYILSVVNEIIYQMDNHGYKALQEAFSGIITDYEVLTAVLETHNDKDFDKNILIDGIGIQ